MLRDPYRAIRVWKSVSCYAWIRPCDNNVDFYEEPFMTRTTHYEVRPSRSCVWVTRHGRGAGVALNATHPHLIHRSDSRTHCVLHAASDSVSTACCGYEGRHNIVGSLADPVFFIRHNKQESIQQAQQHNIRGLACQASRARLSGAIVSTRHSPPWSQPISRLNYIPLVNPTHVHPFHLVHSH